MIKDKKNMKSLGKGQDRWTSSRKLAFGDGDGWGKPSRNLVIISLVWLQ